MNNKIIKRVWVGDLCYVLTDERWQDLCEQMGDGRAYLSDNGKTFALSGTAYGDGCYDGRYSPTQKVFRSYGVDTGTIGVIWEDAMDNEDGGGHYFEVEVLDPDNLPRLGVNYDNGQIEILVGGEVIEVIDTSGDSDYYDEDEDEEDYEGDDEDYEEEDDE